MDAYQRTLQIELLRQRFHVEGTTEKDEEFTVTLAPSDADFPYEIETLQFILTVPHQYPKATPIIRILNVDIPVEYKANISSQFVSLALKARTSTLLDLVTVLDKNLERFIRGEKATTLKVVPNIPQGGQSPQPATPLPPATVNDHNSVSFTLQEKIEAKARRTKELRQLETRLGESLVKYDDGVTFRVPVTPAKRELLPVPLQSLDSVRFIVPINYCLDAPRIQLLGYPGDLSSRIEARFMEHALKNPNHTLMALLNNLVSKLHQMAVYEEAEETTTPIQCNSGLQTGNNSIGQVTESDIQIVSRPPEWSMSDNDSSDSANDSKDEGFNEKSSNQPDIKSERGIALSLPGIQLSNVQLFDVFMLSVSIKCTRCKTQADVGLKLDTSGPNKRRRAWLGRCDKCSQVLGVDFRKEFIHEHSSRLGYFDVVGCVVNELLPSDFTVECAKCSTSFPPPGIKGLSPGQRISVRCRQCHVRMDVYIAASKLLRITDENLQVDTSVPHKVREKENFMVGRELPFRGACSHYKKSTRWFRFSCCAKVFACDKCHDEAGLGHVYEHANRMICGTCSREQNYRPEDCAFCHNKFFKKNTGYWEGGKGTRDQRQTAPTKNYSTPEPLTRIQTPPQK